MSQLQIKILRQSDQKAVNAALVSGLSPSDLEAVEAEWLLDRTEIRRALDQAGVPRDLHPQSLHWRWNMKAPSLNNLAMNGFGITCEGMWQGLMLTATAPHVARLPPDTGKPLVYIDYVEAAPRNWNIRELGRTRRFESIGGALFWQAVKQSDEEGFHGRVGLHALPQATVFYEKLGMTPLGIDTAKRLPYFELSRPGAQKILSMGVQS